MADVVMEDIGVGKPGVPLAPMALWAMIGEVDIAQLKG
jgi:hypothetical protein